MRGAIKDAIRIHGVSLAFLHYWIVMTVIYCHGGAYFVPCPEITSLVVELECKWGCHPPLRSPLMKQEIRVSELLVMNFLSCVPNFSSKSSVKLWVILHLDALSKGIQKQEKLSVKMQLIGEFLVCQVCYWQKQNKKVLDNLIFCRVKNVSHRKIEFFATVGIRSPLIAKDFSPIQSHW